MPDLKLPIAAKTIQIFQETLPDGELSQEENIVFTPRAAQVRRMIPAGWNTTERQCGAG